MLTELKQRFKEYIVENYRDIFYITKDANEEREYIDSMFKEVEPYHAELLEEVRLRKLQPTEMQELCWKFLMEILPPSRYQYLEHLLEKERPNILDQLDKSGMRVNTLFSVVNNLEDIFDEFDFNKDNIEDEELKQAILESIENRGLV